MLNVLWLILKIIGITLLILLGIVLILAAIVLFVPVRYRVEISHYERPKAVVKASWLMHLVRFSALYEEKFEYRLKILWFTLVSSEADKTVKAKPQKKSKKVKKEKTIFDDEPEAFSLSKQEAQKEDNVINYINKAEENRLKQEADKDRQAEISISDKRSEEKLSDSTEDNKIKPKGSFFKQICDKIKEIYQKFCAVVCRIREKIKGILNRSIDLKEEISKKAQSIKEFIEDEENKLLANFLFGNVKALLHKLKPDKCKLYVHFGFDNPETTGQIAMWLAVVYGLLGLDMQIIPEFDESVLEAELFVKGRICMFGLLCIAIKVYFNDLVQKKFIKKG